MPIAPDAFTLACVVINWNNWQDTSACLGSLERQDYPSLRVLVVDNGSTNDSVAQLRALHPWITLIENPTNDGFPKACNLGARHPLALDADFLWLLNNDTVAPADTACKLAAAARAQPEAGIIGAVLFYMHQPARVQAWAGGNISLWTGYTRHFTAPAPLGPRSYITFASALVRRSLFDSLGGLYEGAFMYFEDADFCLRAQAAGSRLAVADETAILHKEGGSADTPSLRSVRLDRTVTTAGMLFLRRHAPVPSVATLLFVGSRLAKRIVLLRFRAAAAVLRGVVDFFGLHAR